MAQYFHRFLTGAFPLLAVLGAAQGQPRPDQPMPPQPADLAVGIPAEQVRHYTVRAPDGGPAYRVSVWSPDQGAAPARGYPVVYLLDGDAVFESLEQAPPRHAVPRAVLVGIGYEDGGRFNIPARSYDYTPPAPGADAPLGSPQDPQARGWARPGGGADRFLAVIRQQIQPLVERDYRVDHGDSTLYGHSYGGLFALHVALTQPAAFRRYVAASPSIWWNDRYILQEMAHPVPAPSAVQVVYMAGAEDDKGGGQPDSPQAVVRALAGMDRVHAELRTFPGLGHGHMLPASLAATLRPYAE